MDNVQAENPGEHENNVAVDSAAEEIYDRANGETFENLEIWNPDTEVDVFERGQLPKTKNRNCELNDYSMSCGNASSMLLDMRDDPDRYPVDGGPLSSNRAVSFQSLRQYDDNSRYTRGGEQSNFVEHQGIDPSYMQRLNLQQEYDDIHDFRAGDGFDQLKRSSMNKRTPSSGISGSYSRETRPISATIPRRPIPRQGIDHLNVETFGAEAVEKHMSAAKATSGMYYRSDREEEFRQAQARTADDSLKNVIHTIRDPRVQNLYLDTCRKFHTGLISSQQHSASKAEDTNRFFSNGKSHSWAMDQLKDVYKVFPQIGLMEDIFDELCDPDGRLSSIDRYNHLRLLQRCIEPQFVVPLSKVVHSRRLLMHSLSLLSKHDQFFDAALSVFEAMLTNLSQLLLEDRQDVVFGRRKQVFERIIERCSLSQLINHARLLFSHNSNIVIESALGLILLSLMLARADTLDCGSNLEWINGILPNVLLHFNNIKSPQTLLHFVHPIALKHLFAKAEPSELRTALMEKLAPFVS